MNSVAADSQTKKTAMYSFLGATGACVLLVVCWWLMQPAPSLMPVQRQLSDFDVQWRCPNGHVFLRKGAIRPIQCIECERLAEVEITYVCPAHGDRSALVRYKRIHAGRERVAQISFKSMVWSDVHDAIRCPDCARSMTPKNTIPFDPMR